MAVFCDEGEMNQKTEEHKTLGKLHLAERKKIQRDMAGHEKEKHNRDASDIRPDNPATLYVRKKTRFRLLD